MLLFQCTYLFKLGLWNTADAVCAKISILFLNTSQTAHVLVARLLPLCNQVFISNVLTQTIFIQLCTQQQQTNIYSIHQFKFIFSQQLYKYPSLESVWNENIYLQSQTSTDGSAFVEQIKDVTTFLMMNPENWPQSLSLSLSFMLISFS